MKGRYFLVPASFLVFTFSKMWVTMGEIADGEE
jgi:hypothetical protein